MRKRCGVPFFAALALAVSGCGGEDEGAGGNELTVEMAAQSGSGESGVATLTAEGDSTRVVIELENGPSEPQPAHIHKGTCADLDPNPAFGLSNVTGGKSETTVDVSLSDLRDEAYAVNVHKSASEAQTYVSCGDIGGSEGGGSPGSDTTRDYGY